MNSDKISNIFHQEALTIVLELVKVVPTISSFNSCPALPSVARRKTRQESVSLPKNYKTGPLFLDAKSLSFFKR